MSPKAQTSHKTTKGRGGFQEVELTSAHGSAVVSTLGATVLSYKPTRLARDVFWLSSKSEFRLGKGIRGGVPVCWPWFGPKAGQLSHGVARTRAWTVSELGVRGQDAMAMFALSHDEATLAAWPYPFQMHMTVLLGRALTIQLAYKNLSDQPVTCAGALHSYLAVDDVSAIEVSGLSGTAVTDKVTGENSTCDGNLTFDGQVDRIYHNVKGPVSLKDGRKRLVLSGSSSTVVAWNPGQKVASKMADVHGFRRFVCLENAHIAPDDLLIAPGETKTLQTMFRAS